MTKKAMAERRRRNAEIARLDAAKRCQVCKRVIPGDLYLPYCSQDCLLAAKERIELALIAEGRQMI